MPRPPRIDYPGALHHVMNRGAAHQATFLDDVDHRSFTELWQEAVVRHGIVVLAYAWMGNHYHALVISPEAQLSETLRRIGHVYTQRFNRRHGRDGALFRGRFHSILIDSNTYLDRVARYVERNPLEAGVTSPHELANYEWSSLHHYLNPRTEDWVHTDLLIDRLGSRHAYLKHTLSEHSDVELSEFYSQYRHERVVLGNQDFVDSLPTEVQRLRPIAGIPKLTLAEIDHAITQVRGPQALDTTSRLIATDLAHHFGAGTLLSLIHI